jgi:hypothetical protein
MTALATLILDCVKNRQSYSEDPPAPLPGTEGITQVPTLKPGVFRDCSPMLAVRFQVLGRWMDATHGHWLDASDMASLWTDPNPDPLLGGIYSMHIAGKEGWPNIASSLFLPERLSLFAGSDIGNERIFLLWLDFADEPEVWVYDSNGESRYADLREYLEAYRNDDVTASQKSWRVIPPWGTSMC